MYTLKFFFKNIQRRIDKAIIDSDFHASQQVLLEKTVALHRAQASINPLGEPLTILYLIVRAWERENDEQVARIGAFCTLYLLAADLIDDVQDEDLDGKPHETAGPAIATNNGITLLVLALSELRSAMDAEPDHDRSMAYFRLFNRISKAAVKGQHRDLLGAESPQSKAAVLQMQKEKTSSLSLITECAALLAGCDEKTQDLYRDIGENLAMLVQVRDDIRDIFGKRISPDLFTGKVTYPVACFLEHADETQTQKYRQLTSELPSTMQAIRELLYNAGAIARSAEALETCRKNIHHAISETKNQSAFHRTFLDMVDHLVESIYVPPPITETAQHYTPPGSWHELVRNSLEDFCRNMAGFDTPSVPQLKPWHLPQWLYDKERKTIFYPDVQGLKDEVLPFQAGLLGIDDLDRVETIMHMQVPLVLAHEMFHYWRDATNRMTADNWHEEWAANSLAVAYALKFYPETVESSALLAKEMTSRHPHLIDETSKAILSRCTSPTEDARGYGMEMQQLAITSVEMVSQLMDSQPSLPKTVSSFLE